MVLVLCDHWYYPSKIKYFPRRISMTRPSVMRAALMAAALAELVG